MSLTRADLENGLMLRLWHESGQTTCATPAELDASADTTLASFPGSGDPWIFAYGSLIWNPLLDHEEHHLVTLHGFHRRFCLWSKTGRGTPQRPGLVLGLDRGGCCRGVAYRIPRDRARAEFRLLWRREMIAGAYTPKWLTIRGTLGGTSGEWRALAFVINRSHPNYTGKLSIDQTVQALASAAGRLGSSKDYLCQTVEGLRTHGVCDPHLTHLRARVLGESPAPLPDPADTCL